MNLETATGIMGLIGKAWSFIKQVFGRSKDKAEKREYLPSDAMIDRMSIRLISKELVHEPHLSVDCFFLVMVHDHGGNLRPDNFMFWSIIDGNYNEITMKRFDHEHYVMVNAQLEFLQLARLIYEKDQISVKVSEMPKSSLRTSFEYESLKYIRFYYLKQDKRALWFVMVGTTSSDESLDDVEHEGKIFIAVNSIKNITREF